MATSTKNPAADRITESLDVPASELDRWRTTLTNLANTGTKAAEDLDGQWNRNPVPPADFLAEYEKQAELGRIAGDLTEDPDRSGTVRFTGPAWALAFYAEEVVWDLIEVLAERGAADRFMKEGNSTELHGLIDRMDWWRRQHQRLDQTTRTGA